MREQKASLIRILLINHVSDDGLARVVTRVGRSGWILDLSFKLSQPSSML